jgi:PiT family inorganic phosphate transporter
MGGLDVLIAGGIQKVLTGLFFAPLFGFLIGMIVMVAIYWIFRRATPHSVGSLFRNLQILSAAFMAFSHGSNDAQKTMGIITMSLAIHYGWTDFDVPLWVVLLAAGAMGLGTAIGGWRVIRTIGSRIVKLEPVHGFAAETSAATVIEVASRIGLPLSTTHVISSSIMGVGASRRLSAVRWGVAGNIMVAWVVTLPACAVAGALLSWLLHMAFG